MRRAELPYCEFFTIKKMGSGCLCVKKSKPAQIQDSNAPPEIIFHLLSEGEGYKMKLWNSVLKDFAHFPDPILNFFQQNAGKFRRLLISGPPIELRWHVWKVILSYKPREFHNSPKITPDFLQLIEKDIERTFPFHPFFANEINICNLKHVLIIVVELNPELGYCQGMNYVGGIFLFASGNNVTEAAIMMDLLINKMHGKGLFEPGFPKVLDLAKRFQKIFHERIPSLYNHFVDIELDDNLWLIKWFMTMFSYSFKIETVIRLWDAIFATTLDVMIDLAIGILNYFKKPFKSKGLGEVIEYFPQLRNEKIDIEGIVSVVFRTRSNIENTFRDTDPGDNMDSHIKINWDLIEKHLESPVSPGLLGAEGRKRANSLIIQMSSSPKSF